MYNLFKIGGTEICTCVRVPQAGTHPSELSRIQQTKPKLLAQKYNSEIKDLQIYVGFANNIK
jgi:hypothetical protein